MAHRFSDAARTLAQVARHVVLPEVCSGREQHDRLFFAKLMIENPREASVRTLRHARRVGDRGAFLWIEVNQEVLSLENLPVERVILDLILTEVVLCIGAPGREHTARREEGE